MMAVQKVCRREILLAVEWIAFKFSEAVLWAFLMNWLTFGKSSLKTRWLTEGILK